VNHNKRRRRQQLPRVVAIPIPIGIGIGNRIGRGINLGFILYRLVGQRWVLFEL
jgi:hypothetical protein